MKLPPDSEALNLIDLMLEDFSNRLRAGENPSIESYVQKHPALEDEIREALSIAGRIESVQRQEDHRSRRSSGSHLPRVTDPFPTLTNYRFIREIGRGGMGVVFEAEHVELRRRVALKILAPHLSQDPTAKKRFQREARAASKLQHPNIIPIHDIGEENNLAYFTMPLIQGMSLDKVIQRMRVRSAPNDSQDFSINGIDIVPRLTSTTPSKGDSEQTHSLQDFLSSRDSSNSLSSSASTYYRSVARIGQQIANGLGYAHSRGVLHRDIKPANILLDATGTAWISDFGLAKDLDENSSMSVDFAGTIRYMAPERFLGSFDQRSDIYGIGLILYELVTLKPAFAHVDRARLLEAIRNEPLLEVRYCDPNIPIDFETIIHKCLRKDPSQRYETGHDLAEDLNRYLERRPILARKERWSEMAIRVASKYPLASGLAVASIMLLLTIAIGATLFASSLSEALTESKLGQAEALVGRAHGIRLSHRPGQRLEALKAIRKAVDIGHDLKQPSSWFDPIRDEAIAAMLLPDAYVPEYRQELEPVLSADLSGDNSVYALGFDSGKVSVREFQSHKVLFEFDLTEPADYLYFLGNDLLALSKSEPRGELWTFTEGKAIRKWKFEIKEKARNNSPISYELTKDRSRLAILCNENLHWVSTDDGRSLTSWSMAPFKLEAMAAIHPSNEFVLLYSYRTEMLQLRKAETGELIQEIMPEVGEGSDRVFSGADWFPDGTGFCTVNGSGKFLFWYAFDNAEAWATLVKSKPTVLDGGGEVRFNSVGDRLHLRGWITLQAILDADSGKVLAQLAGRRLPSVTRPRVDDITRLGNFTTQSDRREKWGIVSLSEGHECNSIQPSGVLSDHNICIDPTSRFFLAPLANGIEIFCLQTGRSLKTIEIKGLDCQTIVFDRNGHFYCSTQLGTLRFPYRCTLDSTTLELDFPEKVYLPPGRLHLSTSDDGNTIAAGAWNGFGTQQYSGCWIKRFDEPAAIHIQTRLHGANCAVSPDGRFVGSLLESRSRNENFDCTVFQLDSGIERIRQFSSGSTPAFSADGKWFLAEYKRLSTESWESNVGLGEATPIGMTSDGQYVLSILGSTLSLINSETGKTLARFDSPVDLRSAKIAPNGTRIVSSKLDDTFDLYDLPLIRSQLKEYGLDWKAPEFAERLPLPLEQIQLADELKQVSSTAELFDQVGTRSLVKAKQSPNDGFIQFAAAMSAIESRDYDAAIAYLDNSCHLLPKSISCRMWRSYVLAAQGRFDRAVEDANYVLNRVPEANLQLQRAEWNYQLGRYRESIGDCDQFLELTTKANFSYALRVMCNEALGNLQDAVVDRENFELNTTNAIEELSAYALATAGWDISLRRPIMAMIAIDRLQSLKPHLSRKHSYAIALALYRNGRYQESLEAIQANLAIENNSFLGMDYCIASLAYHHLSNTVKAREFLDLAKATDSSELNAVEMRAFRLLLAETSANLDLSAQ